MNKYVILTYNYAKLTYIYDILYVRSPVGIFCAPTQFVGYAVP